MQTASEPQPGPPCVRRSERGPDRLRPAREPNRRNERHSRKIESAWVDFVRKFSLWRQPRIRRRGRARQHHFVQGLRLRWDRQNENLQRARRDRAGKRYTRSRTFGITRGGRITHAVSECVARRKSIASGKRVAVANPNCFANRVAKPIGNAHAASPTTPKTHADTAFASANAG